MTSIMLDDKLIRTKLLVYLKLYDYASNMIFFSLKYVYYLF